MTQLSSLPVLGVQIAFNPTNLQSLSQTWTDVSQYVRDFSTNSGRQHFLDRIEASTIRMTLDNRNGYFLNGATNGTNAIIRTRLPIRVVVGTPQINVTAISGSGTVVTYTAANTYAAGQQVVIQGATTAGFNGVFTIASASSSQFTVASTITGASSTATAGFAYPLFYGLTESAEERVTDQMNQDILLTATDNTKYLSLLYMSKPLFYGQFVNSTVTTSTSSVTIATGSKTFTVPTLASIPATGTAVSIMANAAQGLAPVIAVGTVAAGTTSTSLVVNITNTFTSGISAGPYTAWTISIGSDMGYYRLNAGQASDQILNNTAKIVGTTNNTGAGALLYSPDTCVDLSNGGLASNVAYLALPTGVGNSATIGAVDFWILGQSLIGQNLMMWVDSVGTFYNTIAISTNGELVNINSTSSVITHTNINVADGQWHHIGLYASGGNIYLYCDGTFTLIPTVSGQIQGQGYGLFIGNSYSNGTIYPNPAFPLSGLISQLTVGAPYVQSSQINILNRFKAGSLLSTVEASGDRIAEVLVLAGFGSISNGAIALTNFTVNDVAWNQSAAITSISGSGTTATATLSSNPWAAGQSVVISGNNYSGAITNITWSSGTATATMSAAHAFVVGTNVTISGSSVAAYNGTWAIQTVGSTTFTFSSPYASSPGTGTGGAALGPSYYNGLATVLTATSTAFTFASTKTATISGGTASIQSNSAFFVQNIQSPVTTSTALDLINQVTDTDVGAFFQNPNGIFEFDDQAYLYRAANNTPPSGADVWSDTNASGATTFYEASTFQVLRDDADVWTTVSITAQNGTIQTYENTAAEPIYGYSTLTKSSAISVTNEQANQEAIYLGNLYQSPLARIGNVELSSKMSNGGNLFEMFTHYLNDQILIQRTPNGASAAGSINSTMVIESISHNFQADPGDWQTSFTLDPYPKRFQNQSTPAYFMLFDDPTYGAFDSTNAYL